MNRLLVLTTEVLAFVIFISLGLWIGSSLGQTSADPISVIQRETDPRLPIPALPDGERILLVVGVDRLNSTEPRLESLWLLTYYLEGKPVQWMPILPSGTDPMSLLEVDLLKSFSLVSTEEQITLNPAFLEQLKQENYWFSGYLILDNQATAAIINLVGGLQTDRGTLSGEQTMRNLPTILDQPRDAHSLQALRLAQGCQTLALQSIQPNWQLLLNLIPGHIFTDLYPEQLIAEILTFTSSTSPWHCEFPTIQVLP